MTKPYIFNIQRYSLHDGPGIRTTIFVKGCPLRCRWCCNPESQNPEPEIYFEENRCIGCRYCEKECRNGISLENRINMRSVCNVCTEKACLDVCPSGAISVLGENKTIDELFSVIERDSAFYKQQGTGGVTVSGGEPLLYPHFLKELFRKCHENAISTSIETCLHVPEENIRETFGEIDFYYCDYKHWDKGLFKEWTGGNLDLIETNLGMLAAHKDRVTVRVPLIPSFNTSRNDIHLICRKLVSFGCKYVSLLPYHRLGMVKYARLGREYVLKDQPLLDLETVQMLKSIPAEYGLSVI